MTDTTTARQLLAAIPCASLSYQEWVDVGMALHQEGLPCALWDEWSQADSRYHPGECDRKWATFGNGSTRVTMGTIYHMAEQYGYTPAAGQRTYGWDDDIIADGTPIDTSGWYGQDTDPMPPPPTEYSPIRDVSDYLAALFDPDDFVCYVTNAMQAEDGKWKPGNRGVCTRTAGQLLESLKKHPDNLEDTFGTVNQEAGVWVCFNPVDGCGRSNKNITAHRYALVESDAQDIETQYRLLQELRLPIRMLVHSGGKSLHAIVEIGAVDFKQYQERVDYLYTVCRKYGLVVDTQDKNPSRLSRLPGFKRGSVMQYIVAHDIGEKDYVSWQRYIEDEMVEPLTLANMGDIIADPPKLKPVLIEGILRQGHKMMLVSSSKAGKTFALIELAISIAEGMRWLGFRCQQGRVLYLNMELDEASFDDRVINVYKKLGLEDIHPDQIDIVHLRGKAESMEKLVPQIIRTTARQPYAAIIVDPIYKLGIADENAASEVAKFCNAMDKLANTGASIIYAHHHSKGAQGAKSSMDRASGSGVFARDADALLDMIELHIPDEIRPAVVQEYGDEKITAWRLDATLREFARIDPIDLFFSWPLHIIDDNGFLAGAKLEESERSMTDGREKGAIKKRVKAQADAEDLLEAIRRDEDFSGHRRTQNEYAADFGVTDKTIRNWMRALEKRGLM